MAQPLQKTKRSGTLYVRPPEIEAAIDAALAQDRKTLCSRAKIRNRNAQHYLPSECLVHLIRHARRQGEGQGRDALLSLLLARCAVNLLHTVLESEVDSARELREDILGDFAELFAIDGSLADKHHLDFFEARFNLAFRSFRITRVRPALERQNMEMFLAEDGEELPASDVGVDDHVLNRLAAMQSAHDNPEKQLFRKQIHDAIKALPRHERNAVVLCRLMGFKEESEDPREQTAATLCGVTGRTIRNRLTRALAKLSNLKEHA
jgi:DNA-directed RNA polymerase specialized sigma24 family protein